MTVLIICSAADITPHHMIRWKDALGENVSAYITRDNIHKYRDEGIDLLYLLLGLETRALEAEIKRLRDGYLSARVKAANAFQEIEEQAWDRGHYYKSVRKWTSDKVVKDDEFLGKIIDARKKFNEFVDAFIDQPTP